MASASQSQTPKIITVVVGLLVLALVALVATPYLQVASWKSSTLQTVNTSIDTINSTNQTISQTNVKLQPTDEDFAKAEQAYSDQLAAIQTAQSDIEEIDTFGIDVFGATDEANETRIELLQAYSELETLAKSGQAQAASDREVVSAIGDSSASASLEESIASLTKAAELVEQAAASGVQKDFNTRYAEAIRDFVSVLSQASSGTVTEADINAASERLDAFTSEGIDLMTAEQKQIDEAIERLNSAAQKLE